MLPNIFSQLHCTTLCHPTACLKISPLKLVIALDIPCLCASLHVSCSLHSDFPARNPPENSPNLGMSILPSELSHLCGEIRGCSTSHAAPCLLSSHIGLVPILHLGGVRLWLTETLPNVSTLTRNRTRIACVAALHANHYTTGPTPIAPRDCVIQCGGMYTNSQRGQEKD